MSDRSGFALVGALWLLVIMSIVALEFSLQTRAWRLSTINRVESSQARAASAAGISEARSTLQRLLARSPDPILPRNLSASTGLTDPWAVAETVARVQGSLGATRYEVQAIDLGSRINLNRATEEEIEGLLQALRIDAGLADRIAQSVLDWRDADDLHRARGAEADYYASLDLPIRPRNGPFQSLHELLSVRDVSSEIYEQIHPFLTLRGSSRVNLNSAPEPVLLAVPGLGEEAVAALLRLRERGERVRRLSDLQELLSPEAQDAFRRHFATLMSRTTTEAREIEVISRGFVEGGLIEVVSRAVFVRAGQSAIMTDFRAR